MTPPATRAGAIRRDPEGAARGRFDLIVVGGGVLGIMIALEATRRRLRPLLLERADFAGATSHNSLRIVHGGLRYLQSLNLGRSLESIRERVWWLDRFPEIVRPLPCLMPLYGDGLRRPAALRLGLLLSDLLCRWQTCGGALPRGRTIDAGAVRRLCPALDPEGLLGGAIWSDAVVADPPRLFIEALRWAAAHGAGALNHLEVTGVLQEAGRVAGVQGRDLETGATHVLRAATVINSAGPWSGAFAASAGAVEPRLFEPVLAWNVMFRRAPPCNHALAVRARQKGAQTYFLVPWRDRILAGTGYATWHGPPERPGLPEPLLEGFIDELNAALPGLELRGRDAIRSYVGLLPAARASSAEPTDRALVVDHGAAGGPARLFSVSAVKLTTARALAERVLRRAFPAARPLPEGAFRRPPAVGWPAEQLLEVDQEAWRQALRRAVSEEAALHLDDLLLRRLCLGDDPAQALAVAPLACRLLGWDTARAQVELERLNAALAQVVPAAVS